MALQVSREALEARFEKIRAFLVDQDLGALLVYSPPAVHQWGQTGHVGYCTGWANTDRVADTAVVVPAEGSPALLFAGMPYMFEPIADASPLEDVRMVRAVDPNAVAIARPAGTSEGEWIRSFAGETLEVLREKEIFGKGIGVAGLTNMPVPFYEMLSEEFGDKLRRVDDIVAEIRAVKTPEEIELMRHASRLGDLGFKTLVEVARPGMRGIEVVAEMERAVRREGADQVKYWMASGPPTTWDDVQLTLRPHESVLQEGDFMESCSYIVYKGYWSHAMRTGTLGRPSSYLQDIYAVPKEAQDAGIAAMRPGERAGNIGKAVREKAEELGWAVQGGRIGHGTGLDYSERPSPGESNDTLLQAGNTIIVHSVFALPGSGKMFVPLGDVCHVTPDGAELLMEYPRELFVAGV